jgi:hypothetical protein
MAVWSDRRGSCPMWWTMAGRTGAHGGTRPADLLWADRWSAAPSCLSSGAKRPASPGRVPSDISTRSFAGEPAPMREGDCRHEEHGDHAGQGVATSGGGRAEGDHGKNCDQHAKEARKADRTLQGGIGSEDVALPRHRLVRRRIHEFRGKTGCGSPLGLGYVDPVRSPERRTPGAIARFRTAGRPSRSAGRGRSQSAP